MNLAAIPALASAAYQLLAAAAAIRWRSSENVLSPVTPPVSLLKPMYGRDARLYQALRSHALQDYPEFEILFGITNPRDPALEDIERLRGEFPTLSMRVIQVETNAPNPKAAVLARLAAAARYSVLVINDDDIEVEPGYFRAIASLLETPKTGLVTCLYRLRSDSLPGRFETLAVATDFAPSVMVARMLGVAEFALGATMALRAETLRQIGGFEPIAEYLADDYELGRRVTAAGYRVEFAPVVVETGVGAASWKHVWRHQLRWSRTIRVSRAGGYYGSLVTHATFWALVAHQWGPSAATIGIRLLAAWLAGAVVLNDRQVRRWFWLIPLRDLFGTAVWAAACLGSTVYWRGRRLRLTRDGRILTNSASPRLTSPAPPASF